MPIWCLRLISMNPSMWENISNAENILPDLPDQQVQR